MKKYVDWARRGSSGKQQTIAMILAGVFFLGILPFLLISGSTIIDAWLHLPRFYGGIINIIAGGLLTAAGFSLGLWSVVAELTIGFGTPLPMLPTQKLVIKPPFTYCRNPMTLGTILAGLGLGVVIGSYSEIVIVLLLGSGLLLYVKFMEEKELAVRFGEEYLEYKQKTPFLVPRILRK